MSDTNTIALQEESSDLKLEVEQRRSHVRSLELELSRKEAELRRAKEEQSLLKELHAVNEITLRKKQQKDDDSNNTKSMKQLKISPESLAELIALEDEIKLENARSIQLQESANTISAQMERVEGGIFDISNRVALTKKITQWDKYEGKSMDPAAISNEWAMHRSSLTVLHEEQNTVNKLTALLNERIEALDGELQKQEKSAAELTAARNTLRQKNATYESLLEDCKSVERLVKKKERLLDSAFDTTSDDYKTLKMLEGDKKVLYNTLSKFRETNVSNTKSILSLEVRLRQLETKLEAVNLFLQQVFADANEERMKDLPEDAITVPLAQFEEACRDLELSRDKLIKREAQLCAHDLKVEQLERKTVVLQNAIASRATSAQLQTKGKEKEFETLMYHVDFMKAEFDDEYKRLSEENATLRRKLAQF